MEIPRFDGFALRGNGSANAQHDLDDYHTQNDDT